jgi:hypothetical protein
MWIDLYCLQPQEKMLKTSPFNCRPAKQISPRQSILFDLLTVNCKLSVDFEEFVLFDCQLSIVNCQFKKR